MVPTEKLALWAAKESPPRISHGKAPGRIQPAPFIGMPELGHLNKHCIVLETPLISLAIKGVQLTVRHMLKSTDKIILETELRFQ